MAYPLISPSIHSKNYSSSNLSPFTSRPIKNVVPTGTVASRIILLQNLATPSAPNMPRPLISRRRENSRTGFGRRVSGPFGKPASRISVPLEHPEILPEHSFLGHRACRTSHMEAHANANQTPKWNRRSGLLSQLEPEGLGTRVQYDATSPLAVRSKVKVSKKNIQLGYSNHELDRLSSSKSASYLKVTSNPADLTVQPAYSGDWGPSPQYQDRRNPKIDPAPHHLTIKQKEDPTSTETTSSMRRRSVRELFKEYGIQTPRGPASSENLLYDFDVTYQSQRKNRLCHACLSMNGTETMCWRCGNRFRESYDQLSQNAFTEIQSFQNMDDMPKRKDLPDNEAIDELALLKIRLPNEGSDRIDVELNCTSQQLPHKRKPSGNSFTDTVKNSSKAEIADSLNAGLVTPHQVSSKAPPTQIAAHSTLASPLPRPLVPKEKPRYKLKGVITNSPSLIADRLSQLQVLKNSPVSMRVTDLLAHQQGSQRMKDRSRSLSQENSSPAEGDGEFTCNSPGCRATHAGHRPYRHSISCSRSRTWNPDYNQMGHVAHAIDREEHAVTSQFKTNESRPVQSDLTQKNPHEWAYHTNHVMSPSSKSYASCVHHQHSQPRAVTLCSTQYVEIHGYTNNSRSRNCSPIAPVVNGRCLHCLNGKQNEKHQSAHQNTYCYMHKNHNEVLYGSQKCRKINEGAEKLEIRPLSPILNCTPVVEQCKLEQSENSSVHVVMPTPRRTIHSPSWMTDETFEGAGEEKADQKSHERLTEIVLTPKQKLGLSTEVTTKATSGKQYSAEGAPDAVRRKGVSPRIECEDIILEQEKNLTQAPCRMREHTLIGLKAKWELESAAALKEKSIKTTLNTHFRRSRPHKVLSGAPPMFAKIEPSPHRCTFLKSSPEEDQNVGNEFFQRVPSGQDIYSYHLEPAVPVSNPSKPTSPVLIPSHLLLQPSGNVRRLSALFNREGTGVMPSPITMSQGQEEEIRTMSRKSLEDRNGALQLETACKEKSTLNDKFEKQRKETQRLEDMCERSLKEHVDREAEKKRKKLATDTIESKRDNTVLSNLPIHDTDMLEPVHGYKPLILAADEPDYAIGKHDILNVGNDPPDKSDVATGTVNHATQAELKFSRVNASSISAGPYRASDWMGVITEGNQIGSDTNTDDAENESFEFEDLGIKGISIIFHLEGREDLVIKADLGVV